MIDHFHRDPPAVRAFKGTRRIGVECAPRLLVDLRLQCGFERGIGIIRAQEIGVADEEAFFVVIGVDELGGDAFGVIAANVPRVWIEHVNAVHLHADFLAAIIEDFDIRLSEDDEHVAAAGVFQLVRHMHVRIDPGLENLERAEPIKLR